MGYTPRIIIYRPDLHNKSTEIYTWANKEPKPKDTQDLELKIRAYAILEKALQDKGFKIQNIEMVIVEADLTLLNTAIRKILYDLDIDFTVDY